MKDMSIFGDINSEVSASSDLSQLQDEFEGKSCLKFLVTLNDVSHYTLMLAYLGARQIKPSITKSTLFSIILISQLSENKAILFDDDGLSYTFSDLYKIGLSVLSESLSSISKCDTLQIDSILSSNSILYDFVYSVLYNRKFEINMKQPDIEVISTLSTRLQLSKTQLTKFDRISARDIINGILEKC